MPQKPLGKGGKSKRPELKLKGGKRIAPKDRVTKVGAQKKAPKSPHALKDFKQSQDVTKAINKRNEGRAAAAAQRSSHTHLLKNKDLKAKKEEETK